MKKLSLLAALFVAAAFSSCSKHDNEINDVEPPVLPETTPLAIAFAEGNSLQFDVDETKIVHYTITGGGANTVVKAEMQKSDDTYAVKAAPTSATEGTITITTKNPTDNCVLVTVSDGSQTATTVIVVSPKTSLQELAIAFAEGTSLQFNIKETQIVHYTITGGSENTVVKAKMQNSDGPDTVETTPTSATEGTIAIMVKAPTRTCVIVSVSDGDRSITATIDIIVTLKAFDGRTIAVETPGTLAELLANYDRTTITELTVIGNLNDEDIKTLKSLPNLAVLDMENVNLEELPAEAFSRKTSLTSVNLPKTLKTIGEYAFYHCYSLTNITIGNSVTTIKQFAFFDCYHLTSITMGNSVATIEYAAFNGCRGLTSIAIPDSVLSIDCAFDCCYGLTGIYYRYGKVVCDRIS